MRWEITGSLSAERKRHRLTCSECSPLAVGLKRDKMTGTRAEGGRPAGRLLEYSRPQVKVAQTRVETEEVERRGKILDLLGKSS